MAVYSPINEKELKNFLKKYDLGHLKKFEGILEGIENTNYKITTSKNIYILTIFEKRVSSEDLPFFIELKNHLYKKNFLCPQPIPNKEGKIINQIMNKSCVLISFLKGSKIKTVTNEHCNQVGKILSSMHFFTSDFLYKRPNSMGYSNWHKIFIKCKNLPSANYEKLLSIVENELFFLNKNWPLNLPRGIIHADVFQDNVFFVENKFSGLIDFYFSCFDFLAYDIALTINAWCFDSSEKFYESKFKSLIEGYEDKRKLENEEKKNLSILLRGAAIRILITRLHDQLFHLEGAFVEPKNPEEYVKILKFHQKNDIKKYL